MSEEQQQTGRLPLRSDAKVEPKTVGFWPDMYEEIKQVAALDGISVSEWIRDACITKLRRLASRKR